MSLPSRSLATCGALLQNASPSPSPSSSRSRPHWMHEPQTPKDSNWNNLIHIASTPENKKAPVKTVEEHWRDFETSLVAHLPKPHSPYEGRSVWVRDGDVVTAFSKLDGIVKLGQVRITNIRDERHEKRGDKKRRLKSMRWRRRFANEVRKKVQLVNEIRARGE